MKRLHLSAFLVWAAVTTSSASAGDWFGWHAANHYGTFDDSPEDVWEDMTEDVYDDNTLEDLFHDPCDLFHFGCEFWACRGCSYAPLHYEEVRLSVLTPNTPYAGASWYRGVPVGRRDKTPLAEGAGEYDKSEVVP